MKKYYELLGLPLDKVKEYFDTKEMKYNITTVQGNKDKDKLIYPRVIKIKNIDNELELIVTNFSDSL